MRTTPCLTNLSLQEVRFTWPWDRDLPLLAHDIASTDVRFVPLLPKNVGTAAIVAMATFLALLGLFNLWHQHHGSSFFRLVIEAKDLTSNIRLLRWILFCGLPIESVRFEDTGGFALENDLGRNLFIVPVYILPHDSPFS